MKLPRVRISSTACRLGIGLVVLPSLLLKADSFTYTGGNTAESPLTGNWNNDINWADSLTAPSSLDTELVFGGSGTDSYAASNNYGGTFDLNRLTFNSTSTGLVTISGNALNFRTNTATTAPRLTQDGTGAVTISNTLALGNALTIDGTGTGLLSLTGVISGASGLTMNGAGTTVLSANNTMTGPVTVNSGTLRATGNANALGTGAATLSLAGGNLEIANDSGLNLARATTVTGDTTVTTNRLTAGAGVTHTLGTLSLSGNTLTVAGGANVTSGTAGLNVGTTTLTGNAAYNVTNPSGGGTTLLTTGATNLNANTLTVQGTGNTTINGAITGTGALTKTGTGTLILSGTTNANTYTGLTTVSGGELHLGKTAATNAIAGNVTVGTGAVKFLASNQISDTSTVAITAGGTFNLNGFGDTVASLTLTGSSGSPATLDMSGTSGLTSGVVRLTGATPSVTFGTNTVLAGSGTLTASTTTAPLTFNFNGGLLTGAITTGNAAALTSTIINVTAGMGNGGSIIAGGSGNSVGTVLAVNLNQTGVMDLGATILGYSNGSGGRPTITNVTVGADATGMSGGIISVGLTANLADLPSSVPTVLYNGLANSMTLNSSANGFELSGGVIDVRSNVATAGSGAITTNGRALTISGGTLLGNNLASTTGAITLSSGYLGLRNTAASSNFTISTTDGSDGRTIKMVSGNTGTFTAASGTTGQKIIIGSQSTGGTWDRGTLNAGSNYTITADAAGASPFAATTATYSIGANSGLNGIAMGTSAIPTLLTLGANSSFLVASSTAAARTYNVGVTGAGNDIVVAASGNFGFGINNTNASNTQIINLNRDKGNDTVTLVSNGASTSSAINIAGNQTGSGTLLVSTKNLTLNAGTTFGGTGMISTDRVIGNAQSEYAFSNFAGNMAGVSSVVPITFFINGTLNGTNTISLNQDNATNAGVFAVGSTAIIGGTQTWSGAQTAATAAVLTNNLTDASRWTNGSVSFTARGTYGTIEASTSTAAPSTSSNYKFNSLSFSPVGTAPTGYYKLVNNVQNDGGSGKEAFYASSFSVSGGIGDGSNGRYLLNLNGQDLYVDRFNNVTGMNGRGLVFQNDAAGSTSVFRAVGTTGDTLVMGGFQALNGATVHVDGGDINSLLYQRNTGSIVADNAAAPNGGTGGTPNVKQTLLFSGANGDVGTFTSFLGSGSATGGNGGTTAAGTNGTFRVTGGNYTTSGYILNAVGTTGLIDTTDGSTDTTLNTVTLRGNTASDTGGASNATVATALIVAGNTTVNGHLTLANATGATNQSTLRIGGVTAGTGSLQSGVNTALLAVGAGYTSGTTTVTLAYTTNSVAGTIQGTAVITGGVITSLSLNPATISGSAINSSTVFGAITGAGTPTTAATVAGIFTGATTSGTASLAVTGDLTVGATNNLALQSNGSLKVGGNVSIAGVGTNVARNVTGTGVGIDAASHFTLNGNKGSATPQTVAITPAVGNFHVGDGSAGTLTGTAAQARLAANLTSASGVDINGSASSLNLGGFTLTANGTGLTVGGALTGNGTVAGTTTFVSGSALNPGNSPGLITFDNAVTFQNGSALNIEINGATTRGTDYDGVNFNGGLTVSGGNLTFNFGSLLADADVMNIFDGAALTSTFTSIVASGSYNGGFTLNGEQTAYTAVFGEQTITFDLASGALSVAGSAIPEPASAAALAALAVLGSALIRRRRRA